MLNKKSVDDINVKGKRVLVRCDFNVPLKEGVITDENRLVAALPTIKKLIGDGGKVILCSHLGKPKGEPKPELSLAPVAKRLTELLGQEVKFAGIITSIKKKFTKNNKIMAFVTIEDLYGQVEVLVFENAYLSAKESLIEENIILIDGRLSIREEEKTIIIANKISNFGIQKRKVLNLNITNLNEETKSKLRGAIKYFCGEMNNIMVQVQSKDSFLPCGAIYCNDEIVEIFEDIIGKENVCIKEV